MVLVVNFVFIFSFFFIVLFDLVHNVEAIHDLFYLLTAAGNSFWYISDVHETANCSFTGISHISEN